MKSSSWRLYLYTAIRRARSFEQGRDGGIHFQDLVTYSDLAFHFGIFSICWDQLIFSEKECVFAWRFTSGARYLFVGLELTVRPYLVT